MKTQTRREFLGKLGWMFAGGILVPYIPKTFYSVPEQIRPPDIITHSGPSAGRWTLQPEHFENFQEFRAAVNEAARPSGFFDPRLKRLESIYEHGGFRIEFGSSPGAIKQLSRSV